MKQAKPLYVEVLIRADQELLWQRTQEPAQHQRWDLRFTEIDFLPRPSPDEPQHFRYATRVLPFVTVSGTGISAGERHRPDGTRTSALRFASAHPLSLLAQGSGYWRYVPTADGIRFATGYDYRTRWGRFGAVADRFVFRPLMGWATAWSFDRLRLWLERGTSPARLLGRAVGELAARTAVAVLAVVLAGSGPALAVHVDALAGGAPVLAAVLLAAAVLLPPLPGTPAARRCLRTTSAPPRTPSILATLEPR
ncbi:hypothetical protein [Streptomyces candidus]|uniref:Membrane protein YndG n=1 Tax=Streptomyces candidus TaxID=67283 RepID=A0A7X0HHA7_9ACTN|nr:hypothetical protein [Streptomyces candidus]MBB6437631.1 hypothetical protein [Streptomyces candidus]